MSFCKIERLITNVNFHCLSVYNKESVSSSRLTILNNMLTLIDHGDGLIITTKIFRTKNKMALNTTKFDTTI